MDQLVKDHVAVLDKNDPEKKIGLMIDEWGTWYDADRRQKRPVPAELPARRARGGAHFNIFHEHAERVPLTTIAQMVNVLQAMILTDKEKMVLTPTYYAFQMYVPFQDAKSLPLAIKGQHQVHLGDNDHSGRERFGGTRQGRQAVPVAGQHRSIEGGRCRRRRRRHEGKRRGRQGADLGRDGCAQHLPESADHQARAFSARAAGGKLSIKVPAKAVMVVALEE
jgi:alpha-N-arabinofuranosidase